MAKRTMECIVACECYDCMRCQFRKTDVECAICHDCDGKHPKAVNCSHKVERPDIHERSFV